MASKRRRLAQRRQEAILLANLNRDGTSSSQLPFTRRQQFAIPHASSLSIVTNSDSTTSSSSYSIHSARSFPSSNAPSSPTHSSIDMPPPSPSLPSSPTSATTSTTSLTPTTPNGFMTSDDYSTASQRSSPSRTMMLSAIPLRQTITLVTQDQKSFVSASSSNLPTVYEDSEYASFLDFS